MKFLIPFLLTGATATASAAPIISMDSLLERPMDQRVKDFRQAGAKGHDFLSKAAFDPRNNLQTRWRAVTTMGRLDPIGFRAPLEKALISNEWFMRNAALIALQTDERMHALAWSLKLLEDKALVVRTQAVRNLIELNAVEAEPLLWKQIHHRRNFRGHESLWIRTHIAEALAKLSGRGHAKDFQRLLMDRDERLYKWAINGLEKSTGIKMTSHQEPVEVQRQKWLARMGVDEI